ncbi:hypothetical protein CJ030_MR8G000775 [Morella rubra]|uniref:Uncharacterized protein n=1 Tax=Morella rubra TaxID=262757 RepID=A0A6A1UUJ9_9ROSI|nr:hypothetical protein CJ030_MR8G000775 [Morella rubra]
MLEEEENLRESGEGVEGSDYGTDLSEFNDIEADYVDAYEDQECPDVADEDTQSIVDWCGTFQNTPRTHRQWDKMDVEAGGEGGEEGGGDVAKEEAGMLKTKLSKTPKIWVLEAQSEPGSRILKVILSCHQ